MDWKEELVKKINDLKPEDFVEAKAVIEVPFSLPWNNALFFDGILAVNLYPIGWVGPGYLKLGAACGNSIQDNLVVGVLTFVVSRDKKFNEIRVEDIVTGHVRTAEFPIFASIDFMSL